MIARWNNKDYRIIDSIEIKKSSREVTYTDLKLDFSKCTMDDLPYAQQEVQIIDKSGKLKFTGFVSDYKLPELKKIIYRFIARINDFGAKRQETLNQLRLHEFIQFLYFQNSGNEKKLGELYKSARRAILSWDGQFEDDHICIDDTNDQLWTLEQLQIKSVINKNAKQITGTIQRFSPSLV